MPSPTSLSFSRYQQDIFRHASETTDNLLVSATAGSGKTTTLVHLACFIYKFNPLANVAFLAFNKRIADEIGSKYKGEKPVKFATFHSVGFELLRNSGKARFWNLQKSNYWKFSSFFQDCPETKTWKGMSGEECRTAKAIQDELLSIVAIVKNCMVDYKNIDAVKKVCVHYGIEYSEESLRLLGSAMAHDSLMSSRGIITYDDMLYLPVKWNLKPRNSFSHILIDEAQDTNEVQKGLLSLFSGARLIAVGDRAQALYGFRGANTEAMENLAKSFNMKELPLSISYRCPTSHVNLASNYCSTIEAKEGAQEGIIDESLREDSFVSSLIDGDMVIARTNAPLLAYALQAIAQGKKAIVLGTEIGKKLITLVSSLDAYSVNDALDKLMAWREKAMQSAQKRGESGDYASDMEACARLILTTCSTLEEFAIKIERIFSDEVKGITFSTVHKAKGLENNRVIYLRDEFSLPKGSPDWMGIQLNNMHFVALTRSTHYLAIVQIGKGKPKKANNEEDAEQEARDIEGSQE